MLSRHRPLLLLLLVLAACSGNGDTGDDAGTDAASDDAGTDAASDDAGTDAASDDAGSQPDECTWLVAQANFSVTSRADYGGFSGVYQDYPQPQRLMEHERAGGCAYFAPEPSFCDPPCEGGTVCTVGSVCQPWPSSIPAGHLTVTGTNPTLELDPQPGNSYYTTENYPNLYQPGDEVTLAGTGTADVAPFELSVRGVPELTVPWDRQEAIEHQDMVITWDTAASPPDTVVIVHMDNDHHGLEAYVECVGDDTGSMTVEASVLDLLIAAGETGIGTYIENAWMARVNPSTEETETGCVAFRSESMMHIYVDTITAD